MLRTLVSWSSRAVVATRACWALALTIATRAWRAARAVMRSVGAVVAAAVAMAACSCCDMASVAAVRSREAAAATWMVAMAAAKSDGVMPEAAEAMVMVLGSKTGGVAMTEVGSGWVEPWIRSGPGSGLESDWAGLVQRGWDELGWPGAASWPGQAGPTWCSCWAGPS
jgi:hypothetical protein